eukprot:m.28636 g.28636  ORF g.28636 m.28636 type:complete len:278 (-) comp15950_c0_seq1:44-877(-)
MDLQYYYSVAIAACAVFTALVIVSRYVSPRISSVYNTLKPHERNDWDGRLASNLNAIVVVYLGGSEFFHPTESIAQDELFGVSENARFVTSVAVGFFLWDVLWSIYIKEGWDFLGHGISCLFVFYHISFNGLFQHLGCFFLTWELSTLFLNSMKHFKSCGYLVLAKVCLVGFGVSFIYIRVVVGIPVSFGWWKDVLPGLRQPGVFDAKISFPILIAFCICNIFLNGLNIFWTFKILRLLKRSLSGEKRTEPMVTGDKHDCATPSTSPSKQPKPVKQE